MSEFFNIRELQEFVPEGTILAEIDLSNGKDKWLELRRPNINGSQIASVCGVPGAYQTPLEVYAEFKGAVSPVEETEMMTGGRHFEKASLSWMRERFPGWRIEDVNFYAWNPDLRIGATIDFCATDPDRMGFGVIENKVVADQIVTSKWRGGERDGEISVPLMHQLQVITQAKLVGASWAMVSLLEVGSFRRRLHMIEVDIHDGAWERVKSDVAHFWAEIEAGRAPDAIPGRDAKTLSKMFPVSRDTKDILDLSGRNEFAATLPERDMLVERMKRDKDRVEEIDTEIKEAMGDAPAALFADGRIIKWKTESRKGFTVEPSNPRVFRVGKAPA